MASNTVKVTLKIRNDVASQWTSQNPVLAAGEIGLENDTLLLKVGDGSTEWTLLPYLNKLDSQYFTKETDGTITLNDDFADLVSEVISKDNQGTVTVTITKDPVAGTDAANKTYVDTAVASAGHLKREIVQTLPPIAAIDPDTIYMIKDNSATGSDKYKEYMLIDGEIVQIGDTSVDLYNLISSVSPTPGNLVSIGANGELIDSGYSPSSIITEIPIATSSIVGGVLSSNDDNKIAVTQQGFMTLNRVSTTLLYVPNGDTFVINGGTA